MKNLLIFLALFISLSFISCGNNENNHDSVIDEPKQEETNHPNELIGTWVYYSGTPKSILSDVDSNLILNHVLTLTSNGNFSESIDIQSVDNNAPTYGNWKASKKTLVFTDWNGKIIDNGISYSVSKDSILSLTYGNYSAIYYRPSNIHTMYPTLIIGTWERKGIRKMVFNSDGKGAVYSNYYNGFYMSREYTTWSIKNDSLLIKYTDWAGDAALNNYKIDYLNTRNLCLKSKDGRAWYPKQ